MLTATRVRDKKRISASSLETTIDFLALIWLVAGMLLAGIQFLVLTASQFMTAVYPAQFLFASIPVGYTVLATITLWILLRALAEIIRLLKKIAGLDYLGSISGTWSVDEFWACSNCGHMLHSETRCDTCGATILESDEQ